MKLHLALAALGAVALAACSDDQTSADSSDVPQAVNEPAETPLPSNDLGNTYPSQTGQQTTTTPGATGGRGSAATGATDPGQAPDANQQQQTPPP